MAVRPPAYPAPWGEFIEGDETVRYSIAKLFRVSLVIGACLGFHVTCVFAQELPRAQSEPEMLPGELPRMLEPEALPPAIPSPTDEMAPFAESPLAGSSVENEALEPFVPGGKTRHFSLDPSYLESTGTWLDRGFWYAQADVVILTRTWERKGLLLATDGTTDNGNLPDGGFQPGPGSLPIVVGNFLNLDGNKPGANATFKLTLGRFLFRDSENRDHTSEFTWFGDGNWLQTGQVTAGANSNTGLQVYNAIDRFNLSFDGATSMNFSYASQMDSFELNYRVKQRMGRDHLEMQPSGVWVRKANTSLTRSFLAGFRFINLRETLNWNASDGNGDEFGAYYVNTDNNLLGTQLGGSIAYNADRWSLEGMAKAGGYWNAMNGKTDFYVDRGLSSSSGVSNPNEDGLSFVGETSLTGRWHIRPNLSIRAGMQLLYVNSIALAPFQLNFIPDSNLPIVASGDTVYMGTSIGIEGTW